MKNKILALLLCVFMVISTMAGCGDNDNNGENNNVVENDKNDNEENADDSGNQEEESEDESDENGSVEDGSDDGASDESGSGDSTGSDESGDESDDATEGGSSSDSSTGDNSGSTSGDSSTGSNSGSSSSGSSDGSSGSNSGSSNGSTSGGSQGGTESGDSGETTPTQAEYTVTVVSEAGTALDGIEVGIYKSGSSKAVETEETDENGKVVFTLDTSETYTIKLDEVPLGFNAADSYSFNGKDAKIELSISLVTGEKLTRASFEVGDVMYDFTFTSADGTKMNLADILAEKELVVINFMYIGCVYCDKEFPYMSEAYNMFKDDMEIIALNGLAGQDGQTLDAMKSYKENNNWPFIMGLSPNGLTKAFSVSAYPTTILIDRYGVICEIEPGAILTTEEFVKLFEKYLGDDYQQVLYD